MVSKHKLPAAVLASFLLFPLLSPALGMTEDSLRERLLGAWVEPRTSSSVWGLPEGRSAKRLFDTGVQTADRQASGAQWNFKEFSMAQLSPDGMRVAFKALRARGGVVGLYYHDSGIADILDSDCDASTMAWSSDGRILAVESEVRVRNNALLLMAYGADYAQTEISGDILTELGHGDYSFRYSSTPRGVEVWRTRVYEPRWVSARSLRFKTRKESLFRGEGPATFQPKEQSAPEDWTYDVVSKSFRRL